MHADTIPHIAAGEREAQRRASNRCWEALLLATTPETWRALIRSEPVPLDQLDVLQLQRARQRMRTP